MKKYNSLIILITLITLISFTRQILGVGGSLTLISQSFAQEASPSATQDIPATDSAQIDLLQLPTLFPTGSPSITPISFTRQSFSDGGPIPSIPTPTSIPTPMASFILTPTFMPSATIIQPIKIKPLPKNSYRADESVTAIVVNAKNEDIKISLLYNNEQQTTTNIEVEANAEFTTLRLLPSMSIKPGKYNLKLQDKTGNSDSVDFYWGTISLNLNQSVYTPGESAQISMTMVDGGGRIVCDAQLTLEIKTPSTTSTYSTQDGAIKKSDDCNNHSFSNNPDYYLSYLIPNDLGTYQLALTAQFDNVIYNTSDYFDVVGEKIVNIERKTASRISPPKWYSMEITVTAQKDLSVTLTDSLPEVIDIASSTDPNFKSYDDVKISSSIYNRGSVLGLSIPTLTLPFKGEKIQTLGFGDNMTDPLQAKFYSKYGLSGHDGADFNLPIGTPVYAADDGMVILAGPSDYGTTVVLQHDWGRSYYGHLSQIKVTIGQKVSKGDEIALSGNTGLSTGPHLHFGIKPNKNDRYNGYYGKINPLPYLESVERQVAPLTFSSTSTETGQVKEVIWNLNLKKGERVNLSYLYKVPNEEKVSYLFGPLTIGQKPTIFSDQRLWQVTGDSFKLPGAQFPQDTSTASFPMETIDPVLLDVPSDYPPLAIKTDADIEGKNSSLRLDSRIPSWNMSVASASGGLNWLSTTLLGSSNPNPTNLPNLPNRSNSLLFADLKPNIDLSFTSYDGYLDQKLVIKSDSSEKIFKFKIESSDNLVLEDYFGHVMVKNKNSNEEFFLFRFPQGIDSQNQRIDYKYLIEGETLTLYPNRAWQLEKAVYPITIFAPVNVIAWNEATVQVGENCPDPDCSKDGDSNTFRPTGWFWGTEERRNNVQIKVPKLHESERKELAATTISLMDKDEKEKSNLRNHPIYKNRIHDRDGLVRYGIDYTQLATPEQLKKIRDKNKKDFSPVLDARKNKGVIKKKIDPLASVIPKEKRLAYTSPISPIRPITLISFIRHSFSDGGLIRRLFAPKVHAQSADIKTIGSAAGRSYTTVANWESNEQGVLTTEERGVLYNDSTFTLSGGATIISGSTTTASNFMHLTVAPSERHNGTATRGVLLQSDGTITTFCIGISDDYTQIDWIRLSSCTNTTSGLPSIRVVTAANVLFQNIMIYNFDESTQSHRGIFIASDPAADSFTIRNSIIFDGDSKGIVGQGTDTNDTATIENVTIDGMSQSGADGIDDSLSVFTVRNTISMNNSGDDFIVDTTSPSSSVMNNNLCEDNDTDCGPTVTNVTCTSCQTNQVRADQFVSVVAGSEDFHLKTGSNAINNGTDLSTSFRNDIDDTPRPQGTGWDIGADEYPASLLDVLMRHGEYFGGPNLTRQPFTF